jgi:outer membrane protein assembly factor BamB
MTFNRRTFVLSALASPLARALPVASQEATPSPAVSAEDMEVLTPVGQVIDLSPYVEGWLPGTDVPIAVFGHANDIVMDAFHIGTGEPLWSTDLRGAFPDAEFIDGGFTSAPMWGDSVVLGYTNQAEMFGVDAATGEGLWHFRMNSPQGLAGGFPTIPALTRGRMLGMSTKTHLFSMDERTAQVQWEVEIPMERQWIQTSTPVVNDTAAFIVDDTMRIHAVGMESGELMWTREMEPEHQIVHMQTFGEVVLANLEWEGVRRLDPDSGDDMWAIPDFLPLRYADTVADGKVVVGIQPTMHALTAIDLESGETRWKREAGASNVEIVAHASNERGSTLAIADRDDRITIIDALSGEEQHVIEHLRPAMAYPRSAQVLAMTDQWLFVSTDNKRITVVDLARGSTVAHTSLLGMTDGIVPVDLWPVGDVLVAHMARWKMGFFEIA